MYLVFPGIKCACELLPERSLMQTKSCEHLGTCKRLFSQKGHNYLTPVLYTLKGRSKHSGLTVSPSENHSDINVEYEENKITFILTSARIQLS